MNRAEIDGAIRRADGWLHPERGFGRTMGYEDHMAEDVLALAEQLKEVMTALEEVWKDRRGFAEEVKARLEYAMPDYEGHPEKGWGHMKQTDSYVWAVSIVEDRRDSESTRRILSRWEAP